MELVFEDLIPFAMTSNTTPAGRCFSDTEYGSDYSAYKAFDKNKSTRWSSSTDNPGSQYVGYEFSTITDVKLITIEGVGILSTDNKIQGSNDGFNWDDLVTHISVGGEIPSTTYTVNAKYKMFRISGSLYSIYEMKMNGRP